MAPMTSRIRILTALVAAATLLFAELAVSAYACPMEAQTRAVAGQADCDEMAVNANLCDRHCEYGSASCEIAKPAPVFAVASHVFLRVAVPDVSAAIVPAPSPHVAPGPAPPAPLDRFTVLRI